MVGEKRVSIFRVIMFAALVALGMLPTVAAATDWDTCDASPPTDIAACSRAINSGEYRGEGLGWLYFKRGLAKSGQKDLDGAIADYTEAIRLRPNLAFAYNNRGNAKTYKGDIDGGIADYTEAIRLNPNEVIYYVSRAQSRFDKGDFDGTIADFTEAIRLNPTHASYYLNRGIASRKRGYTDRALADFTEAIRLDPKYGRAYVNRGVIREGQGDLSGATADYTEASRLDPRYARIFASFLAAAPGAPAPAAPTRADAQGKGWAAPGSAAECQKLAQSSIARKTAGYYDLCVSDPPSRTLPKTAAAHAPARPGTAAMPPPSPLTAGGCGWYGGSLRPNGGCWIIGVVTSDCNDMHGRVTEDEGYKYCVLGSTPGGIAPPGTPATAAPDASPAPSSDYALDRCRDGAVAPWTVVGCYNLLGQPAAQNRPGALLARLRESLEGDMRAADAAAQQRREDAEEAAMAARLYRDWRGDAVHRYDRWAAEHHGFVVEDKVARDACAGRWTFDGTSPGSCDPGQRRARWELAFNARQPPSAAEAGRVADKGLPWRTNSQSDCLNAGGIPLRPATDNDITGLPPQLLADPTVDQASLKHAYLCYQTIGR